jgi:hypothetical protein
LSRQKIHGTNGFDDTLSREQTIPFAKEVLGIDLECTPSSKKLIDLKNVNDPDMGVEIEHSLSWTGNYWDISNYGLNTISNIGFPTVNLPWWRKFKYWNENIDPGWNKNIYIRWNKDFTCAIVIRPEVILNRKMAIDTMFKTYKITTGQVEIWKSFRREHVETYVYNLTERKYLLDESYKKLS